MKARLVSLLAPRIELTGRQLAQRKYRRSAKGKAARRISYLNRRASPTKRIQDCEWGARWTRANPIKRRVYNRTWMRVNRQKGNTNA